MDLFAAWKGIREQLFDPRTNLFYDYTTSHDRAQKFRYLPAPEEVAADFPNPCGWGTGMEDCMLNAGSALDILCKLIPDPLVSARGVQGIALCCEGHHRPGFVARGMTPTDEPRCYSNTSRDQLTLAVYGLWRVLHSGGGPVTGTAREAHSPAGTDRRRLSAIHHAGTPVQSFPTRRETCAGFHTLELRAP